MGRPWVAWAGIVGGSLVVVASELVGLVWWAGVGIAAVALVIAGLLGRAARGALTAQTAALLGFGGLTVVALFLAPRAGLCWPVSAGEPRRVGPWSTSGAIMVVPRSLAEFCMLLDVPLGVRFRRPRGDPLTDSCCVAGPVPR